MAGSMLLPGLGTETWLMFENLGSALKKWHAQYPQKGYLATG
jgi:hypothetical protein